MSARDVRHLVTCVLCGKLGTTSQYMTKVPIVLRLAPKAHAHPRCLVRGSDKSPDVQFILRLGISEIEKVRVFDLPPKARHAVMSGYWTELRKAARKAAAS